jgi:hypothetical protein
MTPSKEPIGALVPPIDPIDPHCVHIWLQFGHLWTQMSDYGPLYLLLAQPMVLYLPRSLP